MKDRAREATTASIWTAFGDRVRGFIRRRVREEADVDDILQDVFIKIHAGLPGLRDDARLEAWLFRVARRAVVDHVRRRGRNAAGLPPAEDSPSSKDVTAQVASWLEPLMDGLSEEDREALRAADLEGRPQKALAEKLGLSPTAVRSRVQRARRRLREALLACCHVERDRRGNAVDWAPRGGGCGSCSCE